MKELTNNHGKKKHISQSPITGQPQNPYITDHSNKPFTILGLRDTEFLTPAHSHTEKAYSFVLFHALSQARPRGMGVKRICYWALPVITT